MAVIMSTNYPVSAPTPSVKTLGWETDHPCYMKDVYCYSGRGAIHKHCDVQTALIINVTVLSELARTIATGTETAAARRPLSAYQDPTFREFIVWSASRLCQLADDLQGILFAVRDGDGIEAARILDSIEYAGKVCLANCRDFVRAQSRQRSGRTKATWVKTIYANVESVLEEYALLYEIGYLLEWTCSGVRPEAALREECARSQRMRRRTNVQ